MKINVNRREKWLLILLGGVVGGFLVISYLVGPFLDTQDEIRQELAAKLILFQKSQKKVSQLDRLEKGITELNEYIKNADKRMLPGKKPPLAAAELQKILKNIARSSNVSIRQEKIYPSVESGKYEQIPVQVTFVSNATSLKDILYQIENHSRILQIPVMKIKVRSTRKPKEIETTLVVSGLIHSAPE